MLVEATTYRPPPPQPPPRHLARPPAMTNSPPFNFSCQPRATEDRHQSPDVWGEDPAVAPGIDATKGMFANVSRRNNSNRSLRAPHVNLSTPAIHAVSGTASDELGFKDALSRPGRTRLRTASRRTARRTRFGKPPPSSS
eukprot:109362-Pyramimonas_sp.AAC.1